MNQCSQCEKNRNTPLFIGVFSVPQTHRGKLNAKHMAGTVLQTHSNGRAKCPADYSTHKDLKNEDL